MQGQQKNLPIILAGKATVDISWRKATCFEEGSNLHGHIGFPGDIFHHLWFRRSYGRPCNRFVYSVIGKTEEVVVI